MGPLARSDRWLAFIQSLKIRTRDRKIAPLHYNAPQRKVYELVRPKIDAGEPIRMICLKARREGISTEIESWMMAMVAGGEHVNALITAHQKPAATRIWNMSKLFVTSSPLLSSIGRVTTNQILFGRSTLEVSTAGSPEAQRSSDLTAFHGSEVAFWPHPEALLATLQTIPNKGLTIAVLESTANGKTEEGELFYDEWNRAVAGDSDYLPVFLAWHEFDDYVMPGLEIEDADEEEQELRDRFALADDRLAWRRWCIRNNCQGDVDRFHQEYPSFPEEAFIQSGLPFFRSTQLMWLEEHMTSGRRGLVDRFGRWREDAQGPIEIWKFPEPGHQYVIGADSSMGIQDSDRSRSAGEVLDMETLEQVAELDAAVAPHIMARLLVGLGRLYHDALIAPEVQSSGGGGGRELLVYMKELDYFNFHRWQAHGGDKIRATPAVLYGWETNARTRPKMLARVREAIMERTGVIHSRRLLKQLASFGENDSGRMEALAGHDDLLFAWGIALMSRSENYYVMPDQSGPQPDPDWEALGIHVRKESVREDRFRSFVAAGEEKPKSFLEF